MNLKSLLGISFCAGTLLLAFHDEGFAKTSRAGNYIAYECKGKDGSEAKIRVHGEDEPSQLEIYNAVIPYSAEDSANDGAQIFRDINVGRPQFYILGNALVQQPFWGIYYGTASKYDIKDFYCTPSTEQ